MHEKQEIMTKAKKNKGIINKKEIELSLEKGERK